jgi:hypothetical protein
LTNAREISLLFHIKLFNIINHGSYESEGRVCLARGVYVLYHKQIIDIWHGVLAMTPQSHTVPWYKPHPFTFGFEYGTIHIPDTPCQMSIICLWYKTYTPRAKQTRPSDS